MRGQFVGWEDPDPGGVFWATTTAEWDAFARRYAREDASARLGANYKPFRRCLQVAREAGATSILVETRYIDADYRSEYSSFYSRAAESYWDSAQRLHFFRDQITPAQALRNPRSAGYLGFMVLRPSRVALVGRTMLIPPQSLSPSILTAVSEKVHLFGHDLEISAVPFMQQDTQLGRCAHVAAWMCHYSAFRRGEVSRRVIADFSSAANPALAPGRPLPSEGLTDLQLADLFRLFGLPPRYYQVRTLPGERDGPWRTTPAPPPNKAHRRDSHPGTWDRRIFAICCRYLNSGFPVLVVNREHAFVLCGYGRSLDPKTGEGRIGFVRHDDQLGPYLSVGNVFKDTAIYYSGGKRKSYQYSPWEAFIVPLPEKLWLPPEPVEWVAGLNMEDSARAQLGKVWNRSTQAFVDGMESGRLTRRSYATLSSRFKAGLKGRITGRLRREYLMARWPRYVWVVEAIDRDLRSKDEPCVVGEAIFDATSGEYDPRCLATHVPRVARLENSDGTSDSFPIPNELPYRSGGLGAP